MVQLLHQRWWRWQKSMNGRDVSNQRPYHCAFVAAADRLSPIFTSCCRSRSADRRNRFEDEVSPRPDAAGAEPSMELPAAPITPLPPPGYPPPGGAGKTRTNGAVGDVCGGVGDTPPYEARATAPSMSSCGKEVCLRGMGPRDGIRWPDCEMELRRPPPPPPTAAVAGCGDGP